MSETFEPRDDNFKQKVIDSFNRQQVMTTLNATIDNISPGQVEIDFPYQVDFTQQHGFIHAGIVSTILDSACGYAAFSLMSSDAAVLSIEFKVNLLTPAKGDNFKAIGKVKKTGKNISVTEGELFAYADGKQKLVATMTATIMAIYDRDGVSN